MSREALIEAFLKSKVYKNNGSPYICTGNAVANTTNLGKILQVLVYKRLDGSIFVTKEYVDEEGHIIVETLKEKIPDWIETYRIRCHSDPFVFKLAFKYGGTAASPPTPEYIANKLKEYNFLVKGFDKEHVYVISDGWSCNQAGSAVLKRLSRLHGNAMALKPVYTKQQISIYNDPLYKEI